jgi:Putative zinc-finger
MDHLYIEEQNIADRYLTGQLSAEEQQRFEEHFLDCQQCRSSLEAAHHFRTGLQSVLASGAVESGAYLKSDRGGQTGLSTWRMNLKYQLSFLAVAALLVVSLLTWPILEWRRARRDLTQAKQVAAEWQRKYEEGERARKELMIEMQSRDRQSSIQLDQLTTRLERERKSRVLQADRINDASRSLSAVPVFALSMVRGGDHALLEPANRIILSPRHELIIFVLELVPESNLQSYRATISTYDDRKIWHKSNLKPSSKDLLTLNFNSKLLKPGNYLLTLDGLTVRENYIEIARYAFRVLSQ